MVFDRQQVLGRRQRERIDGAQRLAGTDLFEADLGRGSLGVVTGDAVAGGEPDMTVGFNRKVLDLLIDQAVAALDLSAYREFAAFQLSSPGVLRLEVARMYERMRAR